MYVDDDPLQRWAELGFLVISTAVLIYIVGFIANFVVG